MPEITLRDYFAGLAMQAVASQYHDDFITTLSDEFARNCYLVADAMIAARGTQEEKPNER
jgi:hypothetical protein